MFNLTPSEIALAISTGITIYQIYGLLGYGATEFSFQISLLIIGFTLIICSLRRNLDDSQLRKPYSTQYKALEEEVSVVNRNTGNAKETH